MIRKLCLLLVVIAAAPLSAQENLRSAIDADVKRAWAKEKITPTGKAGDAAFLRRVYLDLVGNIPTFEEAEKFLADTDPKKREKLIDRLLDDPRFGQNQAIVYDQLLFGRNPPNGEATRKRDGFRAWLQERFNKNLPYDQLVKEVLTGDEESGLFYIQYRNQVEETTVAVTRIFMGTQVQCARCHDHPYEPTTQIDFYGMAGFFARLVYVDGGGKGTMKYRVGEKSTGDVLFTGSVKDQKPGQKGEPVAPKFLGGKPLAEPPLPAGFKEIDLKTSKELPKPVFSRKEKFVEWLIAPENPYFARAAVNRFWAQYLGRGFVNPVDDLSDQNKPSHPELFDRMVKEFTAKKFDLKWLIREIVNSEAYQTASVGSSTDAVTAWYERARVRPLSAEEMLASMRTATGFDLGLKPGEAKLPASMEEYMARYLGEPNNGRGDFQAGLSEHLFMNNAAQVSQLIAVRKGTLADLLATSKDSWEQKVDRLYLSTLTRLPRKEEREKFIGYLTQDVASKAPGARETLVREAIWALLNCSEFRFNH